MTALINAEKLRSDLVRSGMFPLTCKVVKPRLYRDDFGTKQIDQYDDMTPETPCAMKTTRTDEPRGPRETYWVDSETVLCAAYLDAVTLDMVALVTDPLTAITTAYNIMGIDYDPLNVLTYLYAQLVSTKT